MGRETTNKWGIKLSTMPGRKTIGSFGIRGIRKERSRLVEN